MNRLLVNFITLLSLWASGSTARHFDFNDIAGLVDQLEDEIIGHEGLDPNHNGMETKLEEDVPHPVQINNWAHGLSVGEVTGVAVDANDYPIIFHRGPVHWDHESFDNKNQLKERKVIEEDTILILKPDTGEVFDKFGADMFYMPHGITVDGRGNIYVTDVGLHQVMRFPEGKDEPDLVLGTAFEPGNDRRHFCKPTAITVSEKTGHFFVADGYCNSRIMKYDSKGNLLNIINGDWIVPHSLALFEREDVICVADREGRKVDCVKAGLEKPKYANKDETGQKVTTYEGIGRVYGIAGKGTALLAITGQPNVRGITIDTAAEEPAIIDQWGTNDKITAPHDVAISPTGDAVYVVELAEGGKASKVRKFEVINDNEDLM